MRTEAAVHYLTAYPTSQHPEVTSSCFFRAFTQVEIPSDSSKGPAQAAGRAKRMAPLRCVYKEHCETNTLESQKVVSHSCSAGCKLASFFFFFFGTVGPFCRGRKREKGTWREQLVSLNAGVVLPVSLPKIKKEKVGKKIKRLKCICVWGEGAKVCFCVWGKRQEYLHCVFVCADVCMEVPFASFKKHP